MLWWQHFRPSNKSVTTALPHCGTKALSPFRHISFYDSIATINTKVVKTAIPPSIQRLWRQHCHHQYIGCEDSIATNNTKVVKTTLPPSIQRLWRQHCHHQYKGCEDNIATINTKVVKTALPPSIQRLWRQHCRNKYKGCEDSIATVHTKWALHPIHTKVVRRALIPCTINKYLWDTVYKKCF